MTSCTAQSGSQDRWVARQHTNAGVGVIFMGLFCGCLALSGWNTEFTTTTFLTGFIVGSAVGFCAIPVLRYSRIPASVVWWTLGSGGIIGTCLIAGWVQYFLGFRSLKEPHIAATVLVEAMLLTLLQFRVELQLWRGRRISEKAAWASRIGFWLILVAFTLRPIPAETRWATVAATDNWRALEILLADIRDNRAPRTGPLPGDARKTITEILRSPLVAPSSPDTDLRMDTPSFRSLVKELSPPSNSLPFPMTDRERLDDDLLALRLCRSLYAAGLEPAEFRLVVSNSGYPGGALRQLEPGLGLEDTEYLVTSLREILKPEPPVRVQLHVPPNAARRRFIGAMRIPRGRPLLGDVLVSPFYPLAADLDRLRFQWTGTSGGPLPDRDPLSDHEANPGPAALAMPSDGPGVLRFFYDEANLRLARIANSAERRLALWKQCEGFRTAN